jgi:hypothetical protein
MVTRARTGVLVILPVALFGAAVEAAEPTEGPGASLAAEAKSRAPAERAAPPALVPRPLVHHSAPAVADRNHDLTLAITAQHPQALRRASLLFRTTRTKKYRSREFRDSGIDRRVTLSAAELAADRLEYAIVVETTDGERFAAFASPEQPHDVALIDRLDDVEERRLLANAGGGRNQFSSSVDYVDFGTSTAESLSNGAVVERTVRDRYYRIEGAYTYRPLRVVSEFTLRAGVVRGKSPVPVETAVASASEAERFDVGLNYGAPSVRFRLSDLVYLDAEFLTSLTEVGFSVGAGGAVLIGEPYGRRLEVGFEAIQIFGTRFFTSLAIPANAWLTVSPHVEVTDMPHARDFGVRLTTELEAELGRGWSVAARGGYQARAAAEGGVSTGASLRFSY